MHCNVVRPPEWGEAGGAGADAEEKRLPGASVAREPSARKKSLTHHQQIRKLKAARDFAGLKALEPEWQENLGNAQEATELLSDGDAERRIKLASTLQAMHERMTRHIFADVKNLLATATAPVPSLRLHPAAPWIVGLALTTAGPAYADDVKTCAKLEEAARLAPETLEAQLLLAECYEAAGKVASAWAQYRLVESAAARANQTERAKAASKKARTLAPRLATLTLKIPAEVKSWRASPSRATASSSTRRGWESRSPSTRARTRSK